MSTRNLDVSEKAMADILDEFNIRYEVIFPTQTGLDKSILDATTPVVQLLKSQSVHDYDIQQSGPSHKVTLPCMLLMENQCIESKVSMYKATTRGDTRFWPGRLRDHVSSGQALAIFIVNSNLVFLNLSGEQELDVSDESCFSEMLEAQSLEAEDSTETDVMGEVTEVEDTTSSEIDDPSRFEVSSYGWDSDVEGLVKRMNRGDIKLPGFQRGFVWSATEQSRFVESLILGLPVPNIFLAKDSDSKTLNIIDGQQRLKTLQRYLSGSFAISNSKKIHEDFRGRYFSRDVAKSARSKVLSDADARTLGDSILHSIVIKPDVSSDSPEYGHEYNNAVIQIFRRLNTSGKPLQSQEVRSCIFYGAFDDRLHELNSFVEWRTLFGAVHGRYKDVEAILRFFALYENHENYKATMPNFLDGYMYKNRSINQTELNDLSKVFEDTIRLLSESCGPTLFKTGGTFLLSKFDAVTVGLAKALHSGQEFESSDIEERVKELLNDQRYIDTTAEFINDTGNVKGRIDVAIEIFAR